MKNIFTIIIVLIIGFAIGGFTQNGSKMFSFMNKDKFSIDDKKINNLNDQLLNSTKEIMTEIQTSAQKESGAIFDKRYLDSMIAMYEATSTMSKVGTVAGGHPELRSIAKSVSKDDTATLVELKKLRDTWYPENKEVSEVKNPPFIKK